MNNSAFAALVCGVMVVAGGGAYVAMHTDLLRSFDFKTATSVEKSAYLERKAKSLKSSFTPNYLAKPSGYSSTASGITLKYNTGMGSVLCGQGINCKVKQCRRYLRKSISKQDITLTLRYTDNSGRSVGSQTLRNAGCQSIIKRWDAGAERRAKQQKRKMKEACSDKNIGMKPIGCNF